MPADYHTRIPLDSLFAQLRSEGFEINTATVLDIQKVLANLDKEEVENINTLPKLLCLGYAFLGVASGLFAQKYSNEFLNIGVGARAAGMGNTQAALANDVTAGYWNPAGIAHIQGSPQMGLQHSEMYGSIGKFDYLGFVYPFKDSVRTVGLSVVRFGVDNIPNTLSLFNSDGTVNYGNVKGFSAADYAFLLTYAQKTPIEGLTVGGNAKIIHRIVGEFATSFGFGIDLGAQYRTGGWRFGASFHDISGTYNAWSFKFTQQQKEVLKFTNNEIPISSLEVTKAKITLGAGYEKQFGKVGIAAAADFNITTDGKRNVLISAAPFSIDPALGAEFNYNETVFLRGGINNIQRRTSIGGAQETFVQPNLGVGLKLFKKVRLDYAYTNASSQNLGLYSHVVSLITDLNFEFLKNAFKAEEDSEE